MQVSNAEYMITDRTMNHHYRHKRHVSVHTHSQLHKATNIYRHTDETTRVYRRVHTTGSQTKPQAHKAHHLAATPKLAVPNN